MRDKMIEEVSRAICQAANDPRNNGCSHCEDDPSKCMWPQFNNETEAALSAIRKFAVIQLRDKPKRR